MAALILRLIKSKVITCSSSEDQVRIAKRQSTYTLTLTKNMRRKKRKHRNRDSKALLLRSLRKNQRAHCLKLAAKETQQLQICKSSTS